MSAAADQRQIRVSGETCLRILRRAYDRRVRYPPEPPCDESEDQYRARLYEGQKLQMARWAGWIRLAGTGHGLGARNPIDFIDEVEQIIDSMIGHEDWTSWWLPSGREHLDLYLFFEGDRPTLGERSRTRKQGKDISVVRTFQHEQLRGLERDSAQSFLRDVTSEIASRYKLPLPPPVPPPDCQAPAN